MFPDLLLELHADGVGLLQEDGVAPQQVPQGGELVRPPLAEAPHGQLHLLRRPLDWGLPWKHQQRGVCSSSTSEVCAPSAGGWTMFKDKEITTFWEIENLLL